MNRQKTPLGVPLRRIMVFILDIVSIFFIASIICDIYLCPSPTQEVRPTWERDSPGNKQSQEPACLDWGINKAHVQCQNKPNLFGNSIPGDMRTGGGSICSRRDGGRGKKR